MKKYRVFFLLLSVVTLFSCLSTGVSANSVTPSVSEGCFSVDAAKPLGGSEKLLDTSKAVILYELNSDAMVYAYQADQTIYPSSMVKIMTALVALERGELSSVATVTRSALNQVAIGSVSVGLKPGEELTLEDLLYCMITASANDASVVIAEHIAGSQEGFIAMMNEKAQMLGCKGTNYSNVHGLHDEQTYTTARDICRILEAALENETFKGIFEAKRYTVPATNLSEAREIVTTNSMMNPSSTKYYDDRVTGGKTGSTDLAGRCLAATADVNGMNLLAIVMGATPTYEEEGISLKYFGSFEEMAALLDYAGEKYAFQQIFSENQAISQYPVSNGANDVVTTPDGVLSVVLPKDLEKDQLVWVYESGIPAITAPVRKGDKISSVQIWYQDICIALTDLVAMNDVAVWAAPTEPSGNAAQEEDSDGVTLAVIIAAVFGVAVLCVGGYLLVNWIRWKIAMARRRRRRRNRRRNR